MGFIDSIRNFALSRGYAEPVNDNNYDEDDNYDDYDDEEDVREEKPARHSSRDSRERASEDVRKTPSYHTSKASPSKVVSIHGNVQFTVVLSCPESIDDASSVCEYLKSNKTVVVNLESVKLDVAQRIVDFLGGVIYALEGDIQYISNRIFVVAPKFVEITGKFKDEIKDLSLVSGFKTTFK